MSTTHLSTNPQVLPQLSDDEIDLRQVAAALGRQKVLIGGITIAAALLSGLYAFTRKPVWEGSFQIVLENQDSSGGGRLAQLAAANPMLAGLAGVSGGKSYSYSSLRRRCFLSPCSGRILLRCCCQLNPRPPLPPPLKSSKCFLPLQHPRLPVGDSPSSRGEGAASLFRGQEQQR